jgi:hypothetical protein
MISETDRVIDLDAERLRRRPSSRGSEDMRRLELAVERLDTAIRSISEPPATLPDQIGAIERTVTAGRCHEATKQALRLAALLVHPSVGGQS